ncbi:hypothetical protein SDC9_206836 [bioreactor metagenome]|uniref:Uncharacterized protein n=1 Tax=bioreactor metagenome TaxID=1076179 RepID=A0A645J644_9ZZZZ
MGFVFTDKVEHRVGACHHLEGCHPAFTGGQRHKLLGYNAFQSAGKLCSYLLLAVGREHVDNTVHCVGSPDGVQGRQHEMSGFSRGYSG